MVAAAAIVGVAAVSAIAQYYQAEKARGANKKRLDELQKAFDALTPPDFDFTIMDPPELISQADIPELDFSKITPEQYKVVGKYVPEVAPYIAEQKPSLLKVTGDAKKGRQAQLDALNKMIEVSKAGRDPMLDAALEDAAQSAQIASQSRTQSLLQDEQRRGTLGSGRQFAANMIANQDAMQSAARQSRAAALASYEAKLNALRESSNMGRALYSDDMAMKSRNTDILNSFNERTSKRYQDYLKYKSDMENDAQLKNLQTEQQLANANVDLKNTFAVDERDRLDDLTKWKYGVEQDQALQEREDQKWGANWAKDERDRQDKLKQQEYDNEFDKVAGQQGITTAQNQNTTQSAQDTNQAIQGVTDAVTTGMLYGDDDEDEKKKRKTSGFTGDASTGGYGSYA